MEHWTEITYMRDGTLIRVTREHYSREDGEQAVFEARRDPEWVYAEMHYGSAYDTYYRRERQ